MICRWISQRKNFSHLKIVAATIQILLTGVNGELKNAADDSDLIKMLDVTEAKETYFHDAMTNPHFFIVSKDTAPKDGIMSRSVFEEKNATSSV